MVAMTQPDGGSLEARAGPLTLRTRDVVLRALCDETRPVTAAELALSLEVPENTIRFHLRALVADRLVRREVEARRIQGRPRVFFTAEPHARPDLGGHQYRQLTEAILDHLVALLPDAQSRALGAGESWASQLARSGAIGNGEAAPDSAAATLDMLSSLGFESKLIRGVAGDQLIDIRRCPYTASASGRAATICQIHLGLLRGLLAVTGPRLRITALDPLVDGERCIAHLSRSPEPPEGTVL